VLVVALGVLVDALMSVLEPGVVLPMLPVVLPVVVSAVPEAPIDVPLPVEGVVLAVVSVLLLVPIEPEPLAVLLLVSLGVEGVVLEVVDEDVDVSSCLPQALRDRAAIRARAAHCAIGDLIIRELLEGLFRCESREVRQRSRCLRLTLVGGGAGRVVSHCRRL
jgi:hypothetical protein